MHRAIKIGRCMIRFDLCSAAEFSARRNRIDSEARIIRRDSYVLVLCDASDAVNCAADPNWDCSLDDVLEVGMCKPECNEGCSSHGFSMKATEANSAALTIPG